MQVAPTLQDRVLLVNGLSKAYAMTGDQTPVREMVALYQRRRDRMHEGLSAIPGTSCERPAGAFYIYPDVSNLIGRRTPEGQRLESDVDVALWLLRSVGGAVMDGSAYGMSPCRACPSPPPRTPLPRAAR